MDMENVLKHLSKDAKLKTIIDQIVLPIRNPAPNVFEGLLRSIVSQQLSVKAAATIHKRFVTLYDGKPSSKLILNTPIETLRSVGLSHQKANYIKNVATYFTEEQLFDIDWNQFDDDQIIEMLVSIKGVGKWTAQMILMFVLNRPDVFPVLDLGIQLSIKEIYNINLEKKQLHKKMLELSQQWRPHRTVACLYFWAIRDSK